MVTADDDQTTDIIIEGDQEEINRMSKVGGKEARVDAYVPVVDALDLKQEHLTTFMN